MMELTVLQLAMLCALVQEDVPVRALAGVGGSLTAGQLSRAMRDSPSCGVTGEEIEFARRQIDGCRTLCALKVLAYENDNARTGFVGMAFEGADRMVYLGFRGSESASDCAGNNADWLDNIRAPFAGSRQYLPAERFARRFADRDRVFFGHSKGGHNALYAMAACGGERDRCVCFNAQGFAPGQLTKEQERILLQRTVNYVQRRDVVGALLRHPERRFFTAESGVGHSHSLTAMAYTPLGTPVPARRTFTSRLIGLASVALVRLAARRYGEAENVPARRELADV